MRNLMDLFGGDVDMFGHKESTPLCGKQVRPNDVWTCVACSYFIYKKNWHKKLRLLVELRIFSKFQGANSHKNEAIKISWQYA